MKFLKVNRICPDGMLHNVIKKETRLIVSKTCKTVFSPKKLENASSGSAVYKIKFCPADF